MAQRSRVMDEWPGVPLVPREVQRVELRGCPELQKVRDDHLPWKSRRRYYFSSRCSYILRTECVLDPAMTLYFILIKSKYQSLLM